MVYRHRTWNEFGTVGQICREEFDKSIVVLNKISIINIMKGYIEYDWFGFFRGTDST